MNGLYGNGGFDDDDDEEIMLESEIYRLMIKSTEFRGTLWNYGKTKDEVIKNLKVLKKEAEKKERQGSNLEEDFDMMSMYKKIIRLRF